jgi:hypothetical protein
MELSAWQQPHDIITYVKLGFPVISIDIWEAYNGKGNSSNPAGHRFAYK